MVLAGVSSLNSSNSIPNKKSGLVWLWVFSFNGKSSRDVVKNQSHSDLMQCRFWYPIHFLCSSRTAIPYLIFMFQQM